MSALVPAASSPFVRRFLVVPLTFLLATFAPVGPVAAASPSPAEVAEKAPAVAPMSATERSLAQQIAADHNNARLSAGLTPLRTKAELAPYAASNSTRMRSTATLGHSDISVLLADFPQNQWAAENALVMFNPASDAAGLWLNSPPHAANMMAARATHVWIDVRCAADGRMWVTGQYVEAPVRSGDVTPGAINPISDSLTPDLRCPIAIEPFATSEAFVAKQYEDFLGRRADPGGLAYWTGLLNTRKATPGEVILSFLDSPEFAGRIRPHAEAALEASDELPTVSQVDQWRRTPPLQAANRARDASIRSQVNVLMIYVGMLNRTPDSGGFTYWTGLADNGTDLTILINGFLASPEYAARITRP